MSNLDQLGRRMADLQDRRLAKLHEECIAPSSALGEHLLRRAGERRRRRRMTLLSVTAVLVVGGVFAGLSFWPMHDRPTVATVRVQAGQRVEASLLDLDLAFDDGSQVVLSSGASLLSETVGPASTRLELERGHALVRVRHTRTAHWTLRAGAYLVVVTGTRFSLDWRPEADALSVAVEEGSVHVSGGLLSLSFDVSAGQSLVLENGRPVTAGGSGRVTLNHAAVPATPPSESAVEAVPPSLLSNPADLERAMPTHRPAANRVSSSSWLEQAEAGRYRDAITEAERRGFDGICRQATAADLLTLAEAARFARRPQRAEQALKAVRDRYARGEDAAVAAYLLGRIAAENRHDHAEAARWFRTYLSERPGGRLDREAEGRLLESLAFMDRNSAMEAARVYLQRYPSGPHALFAKNLLGL
jgi:transmembrane sensor